MTSNNSYFYPDTESGNQRQDDYVPNPLIGAGINDCKKNIAEISDSSTSSDELLFSDGDEIDFDEFVEKKPIKKPSTVIITRNLINTYFSDLESNIYFDRKDFGYYLEMKSGDFILVWPDFEDIIKKKMECLFYDPIVFPKIDSTSSPVDGDKNDITLVAKNLKKKAISMFNDLYDPRKPCIKFLCKYAELRQGKWIINADALNTENQHPIMKFLLDARYRRFSPVYIIKKGLALEETFKTLTDDKPPNSTELLEALGADLRKKSGIVKKIVRIAREEALTLSMEYRLLRPLPGISSQELTTLPEDGVATMSGKTFACRCLELAMRTSLKLVDNDVILFNNYITLIFDNVAPISDFATYSKNTYLYF
jgi:hypothetical protein